MSDMNTSPLSLNLSQKPPQQPSQPEQDQRVALANAAAAAVNLAAISSQASVIAANSQADLAVLFECPVCFDYVLPPIFQCDSGHLICTNCKPKLQCCPSCRGPLGGVRNLAMEKVAETVQFPCKYASSGCSLRMLHKAKRAHEEICEYRPYSCPCPGTSCKWSGNLDLVLDHLLTAHKTITTLQGEDIVFLATDINLPGAVDWVMMQCCFDHYFMLVLEKQERHEGHQQFFAVVQIIGTEKQAEAFRYMYMYINIYTCTMYVCMCIYGMCMLTVFHTCHRVLPKQVLRESGWAWFGRSL